MAISFVLINDLIREYIQYRNLTSTSRIFDFELSKLPYEQYRADRVVESLTIQIHQFDISGLIDYWTQIEQHLLLTLPVNHQQLTPLFSKIRLNLYRCYLIHAVKSSKMDKINEFFDRLIKVLQQTSEWTKEWFLLPFLKNPETDSLFQIYFSKQWNKLFWISLQNFLCVAFHHMKLPKLIATQPVRSLSFGNALSLPSFTSRSSTSSVSSKVHADEMYMDEEKLSTKAFLQSNQNIISKLRNKLESNISQSQAMTSTVQELTINKQDLSILLTNDSTNSQHPSSLTRSKSAIFTDE